MKQNKLIDILSMCGLLHPDVKKELMDNVKREIGIGVCISGISYTLILNFDSEKNLTKVKLTPELDRDMPSFTTHTMGGDGIYPIRTKVFNHFLASVHDIVLKHTLSLNTDENRQYTYYFKNKEYTLYIHNDGYEFEWESISRDGKYHISAQQAGCGEYTYQLSLNKDLVPRSFTRIHEGTFIDLDDVLLHVKYLYDESKQDPSTGDTNFLEETLDCLNRLKVNTKDVICVAYGDVYMSWGAFAKNADFRYDSGLGNMEVSDKIFIYTRDYIIYRHEYDGAEEWRAISTLESVISNKSQIPNDTEVDFKVD